MQVHPSSCVAFCQCATDKLLSLESGMNQTDWKLQYARLSDQQKQAQARQQSLEKLLRLIIIKLSQTGQGVSSLLDAALQQLELAARKGDHKQLKTALASLESRLAEFEKSKGEGQKHESARLLVALLQRMPLNSEQRKQIKNILIDLLRNCNIGLESDAVKVDLDRIAEVLSTASDSSIPIINLLDEIAVMPGMGPGVEAIKQKASSQDGEVDWNILLDELAQAIHLSMLETSQEKVELESFIATVSEELKDINELIGSSVAPSDDDPTLQLQTLMDTNVDRMHEQMQSARSLESLKHNLTENLRAIRKGVESYVAEERQRQLEVEQNQQDLRQRISQMTLETTQLKIKLNENREKLLKDTLTGVNSRLAYDERMTHEYAQWKRYGGDVCYALLDIDHFKKINDRYGHNAGDKALSLIAQTIEGAIRETDFMARIGGEEFVALFPGTDLSQAVMVAEKVRQTVELCDFHYKNEKVSITISIGVAAFHAGDLPKTIYERADRALYQAKNRGRNAVFAEEN